MKWFKLDRKVAVLGITVSVVGLAWGQLGSGQDAPSVAGIRGVGLHICPLDRHRITPLSMGRELIDTQVGCIQCHAAGNPRDDWTTLTEARTWQNEDLHSQAYRVLFSSRSQAMGRILGIPEIDGVSQVHRDARCLACHTSYPMQGLTLNAGLMPADLTRDPRIVLGVSCQGCHGAAGEARHDDQQLDGWITEHLRGAQDISLRDGKYWRFRDPQEKQTEFGYYNLHSSRSRARICVSCHVGSAVDGRVVTHEMYAAGHPPLPPFELASFESSMPRHWRSLHEKPENVRLEFLLETEQSASDVDPPSLQSLRNVLVASAVVWSEQLRLTADLVAGEAATPALNGPWPELAQFDCLACHHELRIDNWRQARQITGKPGRPLLSVWPSVLLEVAVRVTGDADDQSLLEHYLAGIQDAVTAQPFGIGAEELIPRLRTAADWADNLAAEMEKSPVDKTTQDAALLAISQVASERIQDYDSARQLVAAFRELFHDGDAPHAEAIRETLSDVTNMFALDLGSEARRAAPVFVEAFPKNPYYAVELGQTLPKAAEYDARGFQAGFQRIHDVLASRPPSAP